MTRRRRSARQPHRPATNARPAQTNTIAIAIVVVLALLAMAFLAFGSALAAPFDFDDGPAVIGNATIRSAWPPSALIHTPLLGGPVSGRPVANYSFALTYAMNRWFGFRGASWAIDTNQTVAYHATSLVLHALTATLLFALISLTVRRANVGEVWRERATTLAAVIAVVWLVHPIQTEAVDYVAQRTELLVSCFYVATVYAAARAWPAPASSPQSVWRWSVAAVIACILGMGSKEVMISAPVAVILYDRAFLADGWRAPWRGRSRRALYAALIATAAIPIVLTLSGGRGGTAGFGTGIPWYVYLRSQGWAIAHYLRLAVLPIGLTIDYGQRPVAGAAAVGGLIFLCVVAALVVLAWMRDDTRWLGFSGALFFLLIAPSSSVIPINTEIAAERRMYLAMAPLLVALVIGLGWVAARYAPRIRPAVTSGFVAVVVVWLALSSRRRSAMYDDPVSLWADAAARVPTNARAFDNLAAADIRSAHPHIARDDSLAAHALTLDSTFVPSWTRRAGIAVSEGRLDDAARFLHRALAIKADDWSSLEQLGRVYGALGQLDSATIVLRRVVGNAPDAQAFADLGAAYLAASQLDSAAAALTRAVSLDSMNANALRDLGAVLVEQGNGVLSVPYLERAAALDRAPGFDLGLLSLALAQAGRVAEARQTARRAVTAAPNETPVLVFAGRAMLAAQDPHAALPFLSDAVRGSPNDPQALTWLATATAAAGDTLAARRLLTRALTIAPGYAPAVDYTRLLGVGR